MESDTVICGIYLARDSESFEAELYKRNCVYVRLNEKNKAVVRRELKMNIPSYNDRGMYIVLLDRADTWDMPLSNQSVIFMKLASKDIVDHGLQDLLPSGQGLISETL